MALSGVLPALLVRYYKSKGPGPNDSLLFRGRLSGQERQYKLEVSNCDPGQLSDLGWKLAHRIAQTGISGLRAGFLLPVGASIFAEHIIGLMEHLPAGRTIEITDLPRKVVLSSSPEEHYSSLRSDLVGKPVEFAVRLYAETIERVLREKFGGTRNCLLKLSLNIWDPKLGVEEKF